MTADSKRGVSQVMAVLCWVVAGLLVLIAFKTAALHFYLEALFMVLGGLWVRKHGHERAG